VYLPECFWCNGEVRLSTGYITWGYCMYGTPSTTNNFIRICNLDGGIAVLGNDTSICSYNYTDDSNQTSPSEVSNKLCPYNTCNMCSKSDNCSWCMDGNSFSCMEKYIMPPFMTECDETCADSPPSPCEALDCPSCSGAYVSNSLNTSESAYNNGSYRCSWCAGEYQSTLGVLYPWGFCLAVPTYSLSSPFNDPCTLEKGNISIGCAYPIPPSHTVNIDLDPAALRRMADPFEDPCTQFTFCFNCLANAGCGWCSNTWGECRSIDRTKNGEYGEQFCARELAFWHEVDCSPTLSEISEKLKAISVSSFQSTLDTLKENVAQLTVIQVQYTNISSVDEVDVLFFQRISPYNLSSPVLLDQQCNTIVTLVKEKIPLYLVKKNLSCAGIPLLDNRLLSTITITENTSYNVGSRPVWSILVFCMVIWFL